jgi:uncharacterized membrane protein YhaH (DUF805 family)
VGLISLLFGFKGRINRLQYWLGSLGVGFGAVILLFLTGLGAMPQPGMGKDAAMVAAVQAAPTMLLVMGIVLMLCGWCGMALQVKRFHDRNQPGWLVLLPVLPMMGLMSALVGSVFSGQSAEQTAAAMQPYMFVLWAINLFLFVNLGCLGGTAGANKYGPPPGSSPSPQTDLSPPKPTNQPAQAAFSLGSVEAAMERAIQDKARAATAAAKRPAIAAAPAAAGATSFGRRPAR